VRGWPTGGVVLVADELTSDAFDGPAGFASREILPVHSVAFRLYLLRP
jgi:hypothetical protein